MPSSPFSPSAISTLASNLAKLPLCRWLWSYERTWLRPDLLAGVTLAAYALPVSLAYASLAGVPPQMGLYCYLVGGIGYALFGTSRQLAVGPTSAISLVLGVSLLELSGGDLSRQAAFASLTALLTAGIFFLAWLLRLSVLVNFISESILTGFKAGAALSIAVTQLPKLLGVSGGGDNFFERVWLLTHQIPTTSLLALAVGGGALTVLIWGEKRMPSKPIALIVVVISLFVVGWGQLDRHGLQVVGAIPAGLPRFQFAVAELSPSVFEIRQLIRLASACFLLSYIESVAAARTFAIKHRYEIDARQELLGLGGASLLAGFWQGYPVAGGLSQSAVNEQGGARSPLALLVASCALGAVLVFLTDQFQDLPEAVLAAVVLVAVASLIDLRELRHLWRVSRLDFAAALVAFAGVLVMGVLDGVVIAVLASVLMLLFRSARPYVAFLGRIPGTDRFSDLARHPSNEPIPGILVFRVQDSLLYFNVEHVREVVGRRVAETPGLRRVICDLSNSPYVDVAGARMLRRLYDDLQTIGIEFSIVDAHGPVREVLRGEQLDERIGTITRLNGLAAQVDAAIAQIQKSTAAPH